MLHPPTAVLVDGGDGYFSLQPSQSFCYYRRCHLLLLEFFFLYQHFFATTITSILLEPRFQKIQQGAVTQRCFFDNFLLLRASAARMTRSCNRRLALPEPRPSPAREAATHGRSFCCAWIPTRNMGEDGGDWRRARHPAAQGRRREEVQVSG